MVTFCVNRVLRTFAIHTLVAMVFVPGKDEEHYQVNHKDGNKQNNNADNLEWVTPAENNLHSRIVLGNDFSGSKNAHARKIIGRDKKTGEIKYQFDSLIDAANFFAKEKTNYNKLRGIQSYIWTVIAKRDGRKSCYGCTWEYADDKIVKGPPKKYTKED